MVISTNIASYAKSLFEISKEENRLEDYKEELSAIVQVYKDNTSLKQLFSSYNITKTQKKEIVTTVFESLLNEDKTYTMNFLKLLVDKNLLDHLDLIYLEFLKFYNQYHGIVEGYAYSVELLDSAILLDLAKAVSKKLQLKVSLINKIDESLVGGVKIVVNDAVLDGSVKFRLDKLKTDLLGK